MAYFLVIFFLSTGFVHAQGASQWSEQLSRDLGADYRIAFGSSSLKQGSKDAFVQAKMNARAELIKSFSLSINSESTFEKKIVDDKVISRLETSISEFSSAEDIAGINVEHFFIDKEQQVLTVAATINLNNLRHDLTSKRIELIKEYHFLENSDRCQSLLELKLLHKKENLLKKIKELRQWIESFSEIKLTDPSSSSEMEAKVSKCHQKFSFYVNPTSNRDLLDKDLTTWLNQAGFRVALNKGQSTHQIKVTYIISRVEKKLGLFSADGTVEFSLISKQGENLSWKSDQLWQVQSDESLLIDKLKLKLMDQLIIELGKNLGVNP